MLGGVKRLQQHGGDRPIPADPAARPARPGSSSTASAGHRHHRDNGDVSSPPLRSNRAARGSTSGRSPATGADSVDGTDGGLPVVGRPTTGCAAFPEPHQVYLARHHRGFGKLWGGEPDLAVVARINLLRPRDEAQAAIRRRRTHGRRTASSGWRVMSTYPELTMASFDWADIALEGGQADASVDTLTGTEPRSLLRRPGSRRRSAARQRHTGLDRRRCLAVPMPD